MTSFIGLPKAATHRPRPIIIPPMSADAVALLLPGMSLNATIFPDLSMPTIAPAFSQFAPAARGMSPYVEQVTALTAAPPWTDARYRIVVAHSFGGMLALAWLLARPERAGQVHGLVLAGTTAGPMFDVVRLRVAWWRDHALRIGIHPVLPFWNNARVTRGLHRLLNGRAGNGPIDFRTLPHHDDIRVGLAGWSATRWEARRAFRSAMDGFDVRDRLPEIAVPTIVLHGTRDCYFTEHTARSLSDGLPAGELRVIPEAGHVLPLTHGGAVVEAVTDLLTTARQLSAAPSSV
ncbi:MAG: alpha/beta hydrolase [Gemmatimonadota bacterium]|nr:alpha/beta hydrolase [Gemmatimonadota bacterium]